MLVVVVVVVVVGVAVVVAVVVVVVVVVVVIVVVFMMDGVVAIGMMVAVVEPSGQLQVASAHRIAPVADTAGGGCLGRFAGRRKPGVGPRDSHVR